MAFKQPPVLHNEQGDVRKVGFELEYANVSIEDAVRIIQGLFGGQQQQENRFKWQVQHTSLGDFTVEFDLTLLTEKKYKKAFELLNIRPEEIKLGGRHTLESEVETALESVVAKVFPYEIACPPVPCTQLEPLETLREALYRHHAEGTKSFLTNAFGTHINTEAPATDTDTLLAYLRAFLLLYPWLLEAGHTDLARKISPFIAPYPTVYADMVLHAAYQPDQKGLISDYHKYNPDRNRPLDLYPLFAFLQEDLLKQFHGLGKVKARNTFHYRLPNSSIGQPGWTLAQEWNNWVMVEELASDRDKIYHMSQEYLSLKEHTLMGFEGKWAKRTELWLFS
ncbi:amidoligase family protein [Pontibacter litorisediminis]|uniref:amidoligase family protein n=1 Tax=Pontibacter litorisediminis TaxID=1846260 RepID=UPI0023EE11B3|nr:amidoligase family protein [Pontibacter litorisediminis]